jgi:hypothetical protein
VTHLDLSMFKAYDIRTPAQQLTLDLSSVWRMPRHTIFARTWGFRRVILCATRVFPARGISNRAFVSFAILGSTCWQRRRSVPPVCSTIHVCVIPTQLA